MYISLSHATSLIDTWVAFSYLSVWMSLFCLLHNKLNLDFLVLRDKTVNSMKKMGYLISLRAIRETITSSTTLEKVELPVVGIATEVKKEVVVLLLVTSCDEGSRSTGIEDQQVSGGPVMKDPERRALAASLNLRWRQ